MSTNLLSGTNNRPTLTGLLCCLGIAATANAAQAQTAMKKPDCGYASEAGMPGAPPKWQIKGTTTVTDLPANTKSVVLTFAFQKKLAGGGVEGFLDVTLTNTAGAGGTAAFDSGFRNFTPVKGAEYHVVVARVYFVDGNPNPQVLGTKTSDAVFPIP